MLRRSPSRSRTHSIRPPSASSSSSFSVPSSDCECRAILARPQLKLRSQIRPAAPWADRSSSRSFRPAARRPTCESAQPETPAGRARRASLSAGSTWPVRADDAFLYHTATHPLRPAALIRPHVQSQTASACPAATLEPRCPTPTPDLARAQQLVLELMAIPGKSGEEAAVADYIRGKLLRRGCAGRGDQDRQRPQARPHRRQHRQPDSQAARHAEGARGGCSRPTWTPCRSASAASRRSRASSSARPIQRRAWAATTGPAAATILSAALEILEHKLPHPPLTFCWFIQEEVGLYGARCVQQSLLGKPAMCFNWDGGAPEKLTIGATGGYRMVIEIDGVASHAGVCPERGVSAIAIASLAIADLARDGWHGLVLKGKHRGTTNVGFIHGGEATNVVTDRVIAEGRGPQPRSQVSRQDHRPRSKGPSNRRPRRSKAPRAAAAACGSKDGSTTSRFCLDRKSQCVKLAEAAVSAAGRTAAAGDQQRRPGRQLAQCPRHSHRHARLRADECPHDQRNARPGRLSRRLPDCAALATACLGPAPRGTLASHESPDDELCLCFHVTQRKVVNFIRIEKPKRPAQLASALARARAAAGAGRFWSGSSSRQCSAARQRSIFRRPRNMPSCGANMCAREAALRRRARRRSTSRQTTNSSTAKSRANWRPRKQFVKIAPRPVASPSLASKILLRHGT